MSTSSERLYLVDASVYVFRAYHSMEPDWNDADGWATHAVHGFSSFLFQLLEQIGPGMPMAVCFDRALQGSFRNEIYPPYKANREPPDEGLLVQFRYCQTLVRALGLACLSDTRYEADDLIGTLANRARERSVPVTIVSADKDLSQLIGPEDEQWDFARNRRWDQAGVEERFGVRPDQIAELLALSGDSVDNIPGVRGVGPTTAAALLRHFDNLDALYRRLEELPFLRLRGAKAAYGKLKPAREEALLYRRLTRIALDAPIDLSWEQLRPARVDLDAADNLFDQVGFGPLFKSRARRLAAR